LVPASILRDLRQREDVTRTSKIIRYAGIYRDEKLKKDQQQPPPSERTMDMRACALSS